MTIRIPRHLPGAAPPLCSPPASHTRSHRPSSVSKSKSLTTSMDKLMQHHTGGGRKSESPTLSSRGSTPSRRLTPSRPFRTPPRTPDPDERGGAASQSPSGSEVSLHSLKSSASSVSAKSNTSGQSNASQGSGDSNNSCKSEKSSVSVEGKSGRKSTCSQRSKESVNSTRSASSARSERSGRSPSQPRQAPATAAARRGARPASRGASAASPASASPPSASLPATHRRRSHDSAPPLNGMANGEAGISSSSSSSRRTTPPPRSGPATPSGTPTRHPMSGHPSRKPLPVFNSYMSLFQVQEKLKKGEVIEGVLRINPKNYEDAYISAPVILGRGDGHLYWRGT